MGAAAAPAAPMWKTALGSGPDEDELRLLALSGHFLGVAVMAEPPAQLRPMPDIPMLSLPTTPDALRPLVRRILAAMKETRAKAEVLRFLAARGWTAHPGDWMPAADDEEAPDVYAPWRDWAAIAASAVPTRRRAGDRITAENWEDYWPAERKVALTELRQRDPAAARAVLEVKLANENADMRLRLLGLLAVGLSDNDVPFLESLVASDRAPKVKTLASSLLARLSRGAVASGEDIAELKDFFSVRMKGLLRRSREIQCVNVATPAQRGRREELFARVDVVSFAKALDMSGQELIEAWNWNLDPLADRALIKKVVLTGSDSLILQLLESLRQAEIRDLDDFSALLPRLASDQRSQLALALLREHGRSFVEAHHFAGDDIRVDNPLATKAGSIVLASVAAHAREPEK